MRKILTLAPPVGGNRRCFSELFTKKISENVKAFVFSLTLRFIRAFASISPPSAVCGRKTSKNLRNCFPRQRREMCRVQGIRVLPELPLFRLTTPLRSAMPRTWNEGWNSIKLLYDRESFEKYLIDLLDPAIYRTIAANERQHASFWHASTPYCSGSCICAARGREKNKQTRIKHLQHSFNHDEELKTSVKRAPKKEKFPVVGSDTQKTRETKWFFLSDFLFLIQKHLGLFCTRCDNGIIEFIRLF